MYEFRPVVCEVGVDGGVPRCPSAAAGSGAAVAACPVFSAPPRDEAIGGGGRTTAVGAPPVASVAAPEVATDTDADSDWVCSIVDVGVGAAVVDEGPAAESSALRRVAAPFPTDRVSTIIPAGGDRSVSKDQCYGRL